MRLFVAGWAGVEVVAVPHAAGTLPGHTREQGSVEPAIVATAASLPGDGCAACGKGVCYFFCLSSPAAIPMRRSFPGDRSLWSLLMAEPKEITVV